MRGTTAARSVPARAAGTERAPAVSWARSGTLLVVLAVALVALTIAAGGTGTIVEHPCPTCSGSGATRTLKKF